MSQTVILIAGPTASGKSTFAVEEASKHPSVIVNADSLQLYRGLPLLTAQPCEESCLRVPHLLYGILPASAPQTSAAAWQKLAIEAIDTIFQQQKTPWIVGGTGFYLKTLLVGLSPMPAIPEGTKQAFKEQTALQSTSSLFDRLKREDPALAGRLSPQDRQRILRALLVREATKQSLSFWQSQKRQKTPYTFKTLYLSPPRHLLHQRIETRLRQMLRQGVMEEVAAFLKTEDARSSPLTAAIGFKQIADCLEGKMSQEDAVEKIIFATRQYAKRQETWFRHQMPRDWVLSTPQDIADWQKRYSGQDF